MELEVSRIRELFVNTARERDAANQARDEAIKARDQLLEENQRLREMLQMSASTATSGTDDSGYDGISSSGVATRTNSLCTPLGSFPCVPSQPLIPQPAPLVNQNQVQQNVWELSETRGFASDGPIQNSTTPIKVESREGSAQMSVDTIVPSQPPIEIDYDELALDFVLT